MSSSDLAFVAKPGRSQRRLVLAVMLSAACLALAGCGFKPMYGENNTALAAKNTGDSTKLSQVRIDPIADRIGQELHNLLRDRMNPYGQPDVPAYRLAVTMNEIEQDIAGDNDEHVRHKILKVTATYTLYPVKDDKKRLMDNQTSRITVSFDTLDDPYNDIATYQDAQRRAVEELADMISTRVAVFFTNHPEV
ncbi:MAG: LPS assembly lipoprotein LptE [Dongiaceae bacterium]